MDGELSADRVRTHSFRTGWRGYRRAEVDQFRAEVAARLDYLENRLTEASAKLEQLGIEDVQELSRELSRVGEDVTTILEEARRTSTDMRTRAAADAASWRHDAESQASSLQANAEAAAEQLRSDAWREASRMLAEAREEAESILAGGRQEVLFIRAEAEREVMHLGGEARRDADELVRNARAEADQILAAAEAEAEQIVARAERAAADAVARTRSLEQRRSELLAEIDAAELSLEALRGGEIEVEQKGLTAEGEPGHEWRESEVGAVRIVAAPTLTTPGPVDADELVAEVEQLRSARLDDAAGPAMADEPDHDRGDEQPAPAASGAAAPFEGDVDVGDDERDAAVEATAVQDATGEAGDGAAGEDVEEAGGAESDAEQHEPLAEAPVTADDRHDDAGERISDEVAGEGDTERAAGEETELAGLFAQLREPESSAPSGETAEATDESPDPAAVTEPPAPTLRAVPMTGPPGEGAFELRERLLLPVENAGLREVKRHLVELQNRVLEELRTTTGQWEPDPDEFLGEMSAGMASFRRRAFAAGVEAVEQMTGRPAPGTEAPAGDPGARAFAESLIAAVSKAHGAAVANEAGARELASAVSRVFRAWRTDEAERRLRHAAYGAYHDGVFAGFVAVGVTAVTAVTEGVPCAECPAGREWASTAQPPPGTLRPPAHLGCVTTIVPAGMAG